MVFKKHLVVAGMMSVISVNAFTSSLDFRHEYKAKSKAHASRIKMGTTFDNQLSVGLELKFKSEDSQDFMQDLVNNGSELGIDYKWILNNQWQIQPGMPIEFSSDNTTFKPQLRLTYLPHNINNLSVSVRYRLDIKSTQTDPAVDNKYRDRYTFNLGYKYEAFSLGVELNYYKAHSHSYLLYDNKNSNYENNLTLGYGIGNWTPWLEFGDVSVDAISDDRELRSRLGIRYSF